MRPSLFNLAVVVFSLAVGMVFGGLVFRSVPITNAAADPPPTATASTSNLPVAVVADTRNPSTSTQRSEPTKYIGVIFTRQSADIVAKTEGTLEAIHLNLGDRVKAGEIIARTESYSGSQQLHLAEATLRSAQAEERDSELELKDAATRYQRRTELAEAGLISNEDLATAKVQWDRAGTKRQAAQARVAEQSARVEDAKQSFRNAVITAPFDGTVAARYLDSGAAVRPGTPVISLIRPEDLWVRFAVPEVEQPQARIGTAVDFQLEGSPVPIPGLIEYVSPSIHATSEEVLVEARLKVPAALRDRIRPGESGLISASTR
jgi:RND family efflux transporter MFP subunit